MLLLKKFLNKLRKSLWEIYSRIVAILATKTNQREIHTSSTASSEVFTISKTEYDEFREIFEQIKQSNLDSEETKKNSEKILGMAEKSQTLVYIGFVVLLVMVAALVLERLTLTYDFHRNSDKFEAQAIDNILLEYKLLNLKRCLASGAWQSCFVE